MAFGYFRYTNHKTLILLDYPRKGNTKESLKNITMLSIGFSLKYFSDSRRKKRSL